ncbi:MAG TPA: hypothetical protein VK081_11650 [Planctomycetota bacterium]|nr:hypothetical protein [Planctomycetota bacterium]
MPLAIGSLVALVAIVIVGWFVFAGGGEAPPNETTTAQATNGGAEAGKTENAAGAVDASADKSVGQASEAAAPDKDAAAPKEEGKAAGADATAEGDAAKQAAGAADGESDKPGGNKPTAKQSEPKKAKAADDEKAKKPLTEADVFDPRTLPPLDFPDYVDDALRAEITQLIEDVKNGGRAGIKAKRRLEEIGHAAIPAVINAYAQIDFKNPDQAMYAFEMNKFMTNAFGAGVVSANFRRTEAGETIPLETADWNAKTVNAWRRFWETYSDKDRWREMVSKRKSGGDDDK